MSRVLASAAVLLVLTACSSGTSQDAAPPSNTSSAATSAPATTAPAGSSAASASVPAGSTLPSPTATAATMTCGEPTPAQLERASLSIASHPGAVRGAVVVPAATTASGQWSVIAVARDYVTDAGRAVGLSRDTGLVSADGSSIIAVSGPDGWSDVKWSGPLLDAGKRAESTALACLLAKVPRQPGETPSR